ncbi:MAG: hypothetical protein M1818_005928 [Claussenomyces sp. TS43310]|nr:MAG: hypothetical protein M1818_005928 [Claussenomyces sp. TS43310]
MSLFKPLVLIGLTAASVQAGSTVQPRQCNATSSSLHNFTLTIDVPGFALDGLPVIYANAGIFTNVSETNVNFQPTYYLKNDTDHMYGTWVTSSGFTAENWPFSVANDTSRYSGIAELNYPPELDHDGINYWSSFLVHGDDERNPWNSNPHIEFKPEDGIGKGGWYACPKWFDDSWRIYGATAAFIGVTPAYPANEPCVAIGGLKVNLVGEGSGC